MVKILTFTERFKENYKNLPKEIQNVFDKKLELFTKNPLHKSLNIHKYKTREKKTIWEAYIITKYRWTFEITNKEYIFRNIGSHTIIDKSKI
ncbi:MAG: hypothetical protein LBF97_01745 [Elusimicrobiota bacterium]|jgi:mRNA-degrading endonuclease RelE of RelBE toxin-antitoxin system|nr:hypothetical protein [Elusimicrobiota bacterium]